LFRKLVKYFFLSMVLLLIFLAAALLAMRFAIQGREVTVPRLTGLTPTEAERAANSDGLVLSVEGRFYSATVPEGRIISQAPVQGETVRRGWKIRVAASLGPQRAAVPNLIGQSQHAAGINVSRRGLEVGTVGAIHLPGAAPEIVVAQNPPADATDMVSPKVGLIFSAADNAPRYVMPNFVGKTVAEANAVLAKAGFAPGKVHAASGEAAAAAGVIVKQSPAAGQRVAASAAVSFEVKK
jgi:beta-lactam-binding protein with PASTA domain